MTARLLLDSQISDVSFQITKIVEGISEEAMDTRATAVGMSIREQLVHLGEAYQAALTTHAGGKHEWGSFTFPDTSTEALKASYQNLRNEMLRVLEGEDPETLHLLSNFVVGHDNYHVGQMVLCRLAAEPEWNSYSIYGH